MNALASRVRAALQDERGSSARGRAFGMIRPKVEQTIAGFPELALNTRRLKLAALDRNAELVSLARERMEANGMRVYVADTFNHRVQIFSGDGAFAAALEGGLFAPRGLAVDRRGRVWVADTGNSAVKIFPGEGGEPLVVGRRGDGKGEFDSPVGIAVGRKGRVYVADVGNRRIVVLDPEGKYLSHFAVDGWRGGAYNEPYIDIDSRGDLYVTDPPGNRVLRYSAEGRPLGVWKPISGGAPLLLFPMGIAVQKDGDAVYVVDCRNHRIRAASKKDFR